MILPPEGLQRPKAQSFGSNALRLPDRAEVGRGATAPHPRSFVDDEEVHRPVSSSQEHGGIDWLAEPRSG